MISAQEYALHLADYTLEPWDGYRIEIMLARLCAIVSNLLKTDNATLSQPKDFLLCAPVEDEQSMEEMKRQMHQWMKTVPDEDDECL